MIIMSRISKASIIDISLGAKGLSYDSRRGWNIQEKSSVLRVEK